MLTTEQLVDQIARERALDATLSFIVQAPAGSGKTELLTQRFLVLLNHVKNPEEILAITFTKKSAHEMRSRIINILNKAAHEPEPISRHAKKTWQLAKKVLARDIQFKWNLLLNPNRLKIQTIDSFNVSLTKYLPIVSQFGATPEITNDPYFLYQETIQEFLSHLEENLEWSESIAQLLLHLDNDLNKVQSLLISLLAKRDQWLPHIAVNAENPDLKIHLESCLQRIIQESVAEVELLYPAALREETCALMRFAGHNLLRSEKPSILTECIEINKPHILKEWLGVAELLLTKDNSWRKKITVDNGFPPDKDCQTMKVRMTTLLNQFIDNEKLRIALSQLRILPAEKYNEGQWKILEALHIILKICVALLRLTFQKYGKIDYIENAQAALTALGQDDSPTDIALALDYRIQHILVDEFQDTASTQYRLLEKLTLGWQPYDGRTLFVVGDPMQSIYRFREAEVGLFIRARTSGLGHIYLEPLTLEVNFRSTQEIVTWVNEQFKIVFPHEEDVATGAVTYSKSTSRAMDFDKNSLVRLHPFLTVEESSNSNEVQAQAIVDIIQNAYQQNPTGKIAILVRTRSHLKAIIPTLKKVGIPYRAIDIDPLSKRTVIQDLMALTRALLHPTDRIAWLAVLRAPWFGLSLADLLLISGDNATTSLHEQLKSPHVLSTLSEDGKARLHRFLPSLLNKIEERARFTLRNLVEQTWYSLGGPSVLDQETDLADSEAYFKLLEKIEKTHHLIEAPQLELLVEKLFGSAETLSPNPVQIMTIHTAKGLEFDTVILPHLERKAANDDKQLLLWMERQRNDDARSDLLIAPVNAVGGEDDAIYSYIKRQMKQKLKYESVRLLYVAATRTKQQLHLLFSIKDKDKNPEANSLLAEIWPAIKNHLPEIISPYPISLPIQNQKSRVIKRLSLAWQSPLPIPIHGVSMHQNAPGFILPDVTARLMGTLLHEILNQFARKGTDWWTAQTQTSQLQFLHYHLLQAGLSSAEKENVTTLLQKGIQNILTDEKGKWILANHAESRSEFPLTALINNEIHSLIIDRTFVDAEGTRWIIDYKTTILNSVDLETFLTENQKKHEQQLWLYKEAMRQIDSRPIKLGLYFPLIPAWWE